MDVRKHGGDRKNRGNGQRRGRERKQVGLNDRVSDARAREELRGQRQIEPLRPMAARSA